MLIALTSGKAGTVGVEIKSGTSWREVFRTSEDLLTASAFGRLTYLDGPAVWTILREATGKILPDFKMVELVNAEFWPRWPEASSGDGIVEPDVFLQFSVGDPTRQIDFIVEAKLGAGTVQYAEQWRRQWTAYHERFKGEENMRNVYLLAIGGLGSNTRVTVDRLVAALERDGHALKVVAATWGKLADAVQAQLEASEDCSKRRILKDIVAALALSNYRHVDLLRDLRSTRGYPKAAVDYLSASNLKGQR